MRQSGILAAAGLYALGNNVDRLQEDHELADYLCQQLAGIGDIEIVNGAARTNMVFFDLRDRDQEDFENYGRDRGVLFAGRGPARMVTHMDVNREMVDVAMDRLSGFFS